MTSSTLHRISRFVAIVLTTLTTGLLVTSVPAAAEGPDATTAAPAPAVEPAVTPAEEPATGFVDEAAAVAAPSLTDPVPMHLDDVAAAIGAAGAGVDGSGIDVALIDTGVTPVAGAGAVVNGPDLSFDSGDPGLAHLDLNGHGTHLAGIVNGTVDGVPGIAPGARVVNVKAGAGNGAVDVSQVIAAIDWVVQFGRSDGLNVRVLVLAYGTDGVQPYEIDPLAHAVENAWRHGIVVVVAGGNDGNDTTSLLNPARDPSIIAVGATDPRGTVDGSDDVVASFSNRGSDTRAVDLVAPGRSLISLRVPGSIADSEHADARVGESGFRGSGSSQAAAVVGAAAALLLDARPELTPDQVKALLVDAARPLAGVDPALQGAGALDLGSALAAAAPTSEAAAQGFAPTTGTGSLEAARGTHHVANADGVVLEGEQTVFGPWDGATWAANSWSGISWSGISWSGISWSGISWSGISWSGISWSGISWSGISWSGISWSGISWSGISWSGISWSGISWSGISWSGISWSGISWSGISWSGISWSGISWSGISWSGISWSGISWSGISWSGISWSGISWSGISWSGISWSGISWSGISWSGISWSGISWSGISWSDAAWA